MNNPQTAEHIKKRVQTRIINGSYKSNSGSFKEGHKQINCGRGCFNKGQTPWNKGKEIVLDIELIKKKYVDEENSTYDIAKELGVSQKTIENRLNASGIKLRPVGKHTNITLQKIKVARSKQVFPIKDSSIEVKIQNYLIKLGIEFYTHQYIKDIDHAYQCDVYIPIQEGIPRETIIECFGNYWHNYPLGRDIDIQRCNELRKKGYRVLVFWENEINLMELNDFQGAVL